MHCRFPRDLIDLVDVDDSPLSPLYIVFRILQEVHKNGLERRRRRILPR